MFFIYKSPYIIQITIPVCAVFHLCFSNAILKSAQVEKNSVPIPIDWSDVSDHLTGSE